MLATLFMFYVAHLGSSCTHTAKATPEQWLAINLGVVTQVVAVNLFQRAGGYCKYCQHKRKYKKKNLFCE